MTELERAGDEWLGPWWEPQNWSRDAAGSIHNDAVARPLGFRGGTVAGSIHMDQFVRVLEHAFGERWHRDGTLSLYFRNATTHGERVRVIAGQPGPDEDPIRVRMEREDGLEVMTGTASVGDPSQSELRTRDLRPGDSAGLRILAGLEVGQGLGEHDVLLDSKRQLERFTQGGISDPLRLHSGDAPVATPSTLVDLLWRAPTEYLTAQRTVGRSVGLFGAIETSARRGPILLDRRYRVTAEVIALGESPKTEYFWFDSEARDDSGEVAVTMRMLLRFMKASSPLYANA